MLSSTSSSSMTSSTESKTIRENKQFQSLLKKKNIPFRHEWMKLTDDEKKIPYLLNTTIKLTDDIERHVRFAFENIYQFPYPGIPKKEDIARFYHGIQHVSRAAMYVPVLANLYRRYKDPHALKLDDTDIKLLQIAVLFHDAAREDENADRWDDESALLLYFYLTETLEVESTKAKLLAEAIANKDAKENNYRVLTLNESGELCFKPGPPQEKNIYQKLVHDADCLDIIRARDHFDANHLDFYQDIAKTNENAFEEMAQLITEARSIIEVQGDGRGRANAKLKIKYETPYSYFNLLRTVLPSESKRTEEEKEKKEDLKENYRIMPRLYASGKVLSGEALEIPLLDSAESKETTTLSASYLKKLLLQGKVFARSIATPSAIRAKVSKTKPIETKNDDEKETKEVIESKVEEEALAALEIRKAMRRKNVPTRTLKSNRLEKQGNPARSVSMLGSGSRVFTDAGFLIVNPDISRIGSISEVDSDTGRNKKIDIEKKTLTETEAREQLNNLLRKIKMGGSSRVHHQSTSISTHNEILYHITHFDAIYFSKDPNFYNEDAMDNDGSATNHFSSILQAIYLQKEYEKATGIKLPIFEYSGLHNFIKERTYSREDILNLWNEMCSSYLNDSSIHFRSFLSYSTCPMSCFMALSIEDIQVNAMYGKKSNYHAKYNAPADANYDALLRDKIKEQIKIAKEKIITKKYDAFLKSRMKLGLILDDLDTFDEFLCFPKLQLVPEIQSTIKAHIADEIKNEMRYGRFFNSCDFLFDLTNGFSLGDELIKKLYDDPEKSFSAYRNRYFSTKIARLFHLSNLFKLEETAALIKECARKIVLHELHRSFKRMFFSFSQKIIYFSLLFNVFDFLKEELLRSGHIMLDEYAKSDSRNLQGYSACVKMFADFGLLDARSIECIKAHLLLPWKEDNDNSSHIALINEAIKIATQNTVKKKEEIVPIAASVHTIFSAAIAENKTPEVCKILCVTSHSPH